MEQKPAAKLPQAEVQAQEGGGPAASPLPVPAPPPPPPAGPSTASTQQPASFLPLPRELLPRVASFLHPNEVACSLRLVCKAAHAALPAPQHATVRLSEPSPPAEFERRWCSRPDALRSLNRKQREQLVLLTARSGSVANLSALAARGDVTELPDPPNWWACVLAAAAAANRLELCRWIRARGVQPDDRALDAAVEGGHADVFEWLLLESSVSLPDSVLWETLRGGHVQLFELLLLQPHLMVAVQLYSGLFMLGAAAEGYDLPALQRFYAERVAGRRPDFSLDGATLCTAAAAGSRTPDWAAKVEWLEGLGCRITSRAAAAAARSPDALARLQWLAARGGQVDVATAVAAASSGNVEVLQYVLTQGVQLGAERTTQCLTEAVRHGHLALAQVLRAAGGDVTHFTVQCAAAHGHLPLVEWAAEQMGDGFQFDALVFRAAALSGSLPLMRWLHERGCEWDEDAFAAAASTCSEEALEWLAERGCPMGDDGAPYVEAVEHRDLLILRCLRRLGCPFDAGGGTFTSCAECVAGERAWTGDMFEGPLAWLLDAGCPVDWPAAVRAARGHAALDAWLQEQRRLRAKPQRKGRVRQR